MRDKDRNIDKGDAFTNAHLNIRRISVLPRLTKKSIHLAQTCSPSTTLMFDMIEAKHEKRNPRIFCLGSGVDASRFHFASIVLERADKTTKHYVCPNIRGSGLKRFRPFAPTLQAA